MARKILTIGFSLASEASKEEEFSSKASLLDWDIVLFRPTISEFVLGHHGTFQGKASLDGTSSFGLKEACEHWRREIKQAVEAGKTVVVFMSPVEEVYIDTGERKYSGTGRNQKTTHVVDIYTNYKSLPVRLTPMNTRGTAMKLASNSSEVLKPYWADFGLLSEYNVLLPSDTKGVCLTTKTGDKPVGAILRSASSSGSLVLLPDIDFCPKTFLEEKEDDFVGRLKQSSLAHVWWPPLLPSIRHCVRPQR
jgi:hypothetical protein